MLKSYKWMDGYTHTWKSLQTPLRRAPLSGANKGCIEEYRGLIFSKGLWTVQNKEDRQVPWWENTLTEHCGPFLVLQSTSSNVLPHCLLWPLLYLRAPTNHHTLQQFRDFPRSTHAGFLRGGDTSLQGAITAKAVKREFYCTRESFIAHHLWTRSHT